MYDEIVTNVKKQKNTNFIVFLGIVLIILLIALGLNVKSYFKKQPKSTKKTQTTKTITPQKYSTAQISIDGKTISVLVLKSDLLGNLPSNPQLILTIPNKQSLIFVSTPDVLPAPATTPTLQPSVKPSIKKHIIKKEVFETSIATSQSSSSSSSSANGSSASSSSSSSISY